MWIDMFPKDLPQPSVAVDITARKPIGYVCMPLHFCNKPPCLLCSQIAHETKFEH